MNHLNLTVCEGHLTRDPETRTVPTAKGDVTVVSFTIASNLRGDKVAFKRCEAWAQGAELIAKHFVKGKPIRVYAEHYTEKYEKDGETKWVEKWRVNNFDFVSYGKPEDGEGEAEEEVKPAPVVKKTGPAPKATPGKPAGRKPARQEEDDEESIPF